MLHFDTFFEPEKKLEQEKKNANYVTGLINYLIGPAIIGILLGLGVTILSLIAQTIMMVSPVPQVQAIAPFLSLGVFGIIWVPILVIISASIFAFLINLFVYIGMKIVNGKGTYLEQFYLLSTIYLPIMIATILAMIVYMVGYATLFILVGIPIFFIALAILMALQLYSSYPIWLALKSVHKLDNQQTFIGLCIGLGIIAVIMAIIAVIIMAILFLTMSGPISAINPGNLTGMFLGL